MDLGAPAPTCRNEGDGRRVDVMLASPAFQAKTGRFGLDWSSGVSTHCLQWVEYSPGWTPQVPKWKKAKPLPEPSKETPDADTVFAAGEATSKGGCRPAKTWTECG
eukprot:8166318-Heterocapsa_arctica.AAC.1